MKNLLALAAVSIMLTGATAFAGCPCTTPHVTQSAAPYRITYVQPVQTMPIAQPCCCNNKAVEKKGFFSNLWTGSKNVYDKTFGSFFNTILGE